MAGVRRQVGTTGCRIPGIQPELGAGGELLHIGKQDLLFFHHVRLELA